MRYILFVLAGLMLWYAPQPTQSARERAYRANNLGVALLEQFNYAQAEQAFREAITLDADLTFGRINLAIALFYAGRPADAAAEAQAAVTRLPQSPQAHYVAGLIAKAADRPDDAAASFQRVLLLDPGDAATKVQLGQLHLQQRRFDEALRLFKEALAAEPYNVTAAYNTALALTRTGQTEEARSAMQRFETLRDSAYGVTYAQTYLAQGRYAEAIASTGAEPELVDQAAPPVRFVDATGTLAAPELPARAAGGTFEGVRLPDDVRKKQGGAAIAFADVDHDGDLDILVADSALQLLRNNGDGAFADVTTAAGLSLSIGRTVAMAAFDFDNRRDIDVLVVAADRAPLLLRNMRDGTFRDAAADAGLPREGGYSALAVGDVNKDGYTDIFLARAVASGVLLLSDGQARFRASPGPAGTEGAVAAQFLDYDNDGLLDLLSLTDTRARLFRGVGAGQWQDVSDAAGVGALTPGANAAFQALVLADADGDGDVDAGVRLTTGAARAWRNDGGSRNASVRVRLTGRVSNRSGVGARVEMRAGSLRQMHEVTASSPAVAPVDVSFGLGARPAADVLRILWPSGILQAETTSGSEAAKTPGRTVAITELDRKPSSCPYLFTWDGDRFEFVTDFMGGGEMGAWLAPSTWNHPDPDEYVRIRGDQLRPRGGGYELRVTNELEEALFVDRLQLVAVDHPADVEMHPNEGLVSPPRPPFRLTAARAARPPRHAIDEHGHDVLAQIASIDRRYPDDFRLLPIRGYAEPHALTLDLGPQSYGSVLLLTGWTDYAFSNDNVAASQGRVSMTPPSLQVKDGSGAWRTVIDEIGFPVGRPQTLVVNLEGRFLSASRDVRILTSMRIYWDRILVASAADSTAARVTRLDAAAADLRWRGFSAETTPDGREPFAYDYHRVSTAVPWKTMVGHYTREGDVRPLLSAADDMFVVSMPGDEIALSFDARTMPELPDGWTRTFLLYVHGYSKEMNPRSASPDSVAPLPFRAMSGYPYRPDEHYPRTRAHRDYLEKYNTRVVTRSVPSIDARR